MIGLPVAQAAIRSLHLPFVPDPAVLAEWRRLRSDPLWSGEGVPHGDGAPILLVPGFGAPGRVMGPLRTWLERIGYEPHLASVNRGIDCSERTADLVESQLQSLGSRTRSRVLIVAHSRGGQFARVAAHRTPDHVAGLVTLGTPFELLGLHPVVKAQAALLGIAGSAGIPNLVRLACVRGECCDAFRRDLVATWSADLPFVSLYSRADRTVRWRTCIDPGADNVEVDSSHTGMLVSARSYQAIAEFAAHVTF